MSKKDIAKIIKGLKAEASKASPRPSASPSPSKPAFALGSKEIKPVRPIIHREIKIRDIRQESIDLGAHGAEDYFLGGTA